MIKKWYIMSRTGPYKWEIAKETTGPHYRETIWFDEAGYDSKEDALKAIEEYFKEVDYGTSPLFVVEAYEDGD